MATWLKQSTAVEVKVGPFVDQTDGFTAETGLTIAQADVRLAKNGGDWAQKAETTTLVHEENGWYRCLLDATDTNTLGILILAINESGALPVWCEFMVVPANVWDSLFGADALQVHAVEITAGLITAAAIAAGAIDADALAADAAAEIADAVWDEDATGHQTQGSFGQVIGDSGADTDSIWALANTNLNATVSSRASQTSVDTIDDFLDTEIAAIIATLGTPAGVSISADIAAIEAQTDDIGVAGAGLTNIPWNVAWDAEVQSEVADALAVYDPPTNAELVAEIDAVQADIAALNDPTVGAIADAVWDEALAGHLGVGSTGEALNAAGAAGDPWTTALPGAYGAGTAGKIIGDNINATISSRATQTSVDTIDDFLDTEIAAIKAKTDNLPSDPADASDIAASFSSLNTLVLDLPTNAELTTALAAADDAVLAAIAALGDVTAAEVVTALMDTADTIETGLTFRGLMRVVGAALAGKVSGAGTGTELFRAAVSDAKVRMTSSVDDDGNRSSVVLDQT